MRRSPAGLSPEIAFFKKWEEASEDYPKAHAGDVGGGDFTVKPLVILYSGVARRSSH